MNNITELKSLLDTAKNDLVSYFNNEPLDRFNYKPENKAWSSGQHLVHLLKSEKAINKALGLPNLILRLKFGTRKHKEKTYDTIANYYTEKVKETKFKSPRSFEPGEVDTESKAIILEKIEREFAQTKKLLDKWNEKTLSKYVVPHPIFGNMTMREITMFVSFHVYHHLNQLKRDYQ